MFLLTQQHSPDTFQIELLSSSSQQLLCKAELRFGNVDYRGVSRLTAQGWATITWDERCESSTNAGLLWDEMFRRFTERGIREIVLIFPAASVRLLESLRDSADEFDFLIDTSWPSVVPPGSSPDGIAVRLGKKDCAPETCGEFGTSYVAALSRTDSPPEIQTVVKQLNHTIEQAIEFTIRESGFDKDYAVTKIMTVSSTSRGTYAGMPVDFDVIVLTDMPQEALDLSRVRHLLAQISGLIVDSDIFKDFCERAGYGLQENISPLVLASLEVRGRASLVGRFEIAGDARHLESKREFLDVTFGNVARAVGYEIWIRRYLQALKPVSRLRLQREIRMGKQVLRSLGGLYGSAAHGLRAHAIEQWIIQARTYRYSGLDVGTLDNMFEFIVAEATMQAGHDEYVLIPFNEFKIKFPVWHPGAWETEVGLSPASPANNLLDFLGDGNEELANEKWVRLIILSLVYHQYRLHCLPITLPELVAKVQSTLKDLKYVERGRIVFPFQSRV